MLCPFVWLCTHKSLLHCLSDMYLSIIHSVAVLWSGLFVSYFTSWCSQYSSALTHPFVQPGKVFSWRFGLRNHMIKHLLQDRPVFPLGKMPHDNTANVLTTAKIWSWVPEGLNAKTDRPQPQSNSDSDWPSSVSKLLLHVSHASLPHFIKIKRPSAVQANKLSFHNI